MKVGWVWRWNAFFILVGGDGHDLPRPRRSLHTPQVETPAPPQRTRTDCTAQAVPDARQTAHNRPRTDTHARTLDTLHRVDWDDGGRWTACTARPKLSKNGQPAGCPFLLTPFCEKRGSEKPAGFSEPRNLNIFSAENAQSASGTHSKSSRPESGTAFNDSCQHSRPCRRGRRESRSCGSPRGRGGCSGRWGQRPACRQDKPPQHCRRRR